MHQKPDGLMEVRILVVTLTKKQKGDTDIVHQARIITFVNTTKKAPKQISLLTNDMELDPNDIILIHYCPRNSFNIKKSNKLTVTHQN